MYHLATVYDNHINSFEAFLNSLPDGAEIVTFTFIGAVEVENNARADKYKVIWKD